MNSPRHPFPDCFALLDDCDASEADPRSRLYTGYAGLLECDGAAGLPDLLDRAERASRSGQHAVGIFTYELGADMQGIVPRGEAPAPAQILLFERCERLSSAQVAQRLDEAAAGEPHAGLAGVAGMVASVDEQRFSDAIARIHAYIEAGDTYQINFTYRLRFDAYGSPLALYRRLRRRQPVPYGALIAMPDGRAVLSLSPELFVRHANGKLLARPMKGTAAASHDEARNKELAAQLAADPKNRAENLMIVDLLRNDLGRIASVGSVRVPELFAVDRFSSVLQMTSTIEADLRREVSLADIFSALYPCGSITGAPKRRTMQIIRELEDDARGVYTGAIGWFASPDDAARPSDFCLSVPIRTLALSAPDADGVRKGEMGVGAGIVHDSVAADEFAECRLKAAFLTGLSHDFELFETMQATRDGGCRHVDLHLQRLQSSAAYFGFRFDAAAIRAEVRRACDTMADGPYRLRLALRPDGSCGIRCAPLAPLIAPVGLLLAKERTRSGDLFLRHKTSVRESYDAAWREAEARGAFDMLFCNERGELTEGGRSNVFVRLDGRWYTPPLRAGVLPGVMRAILLDDPAWDASERSLTPGDLDRAEEIVVCNALRGPLSARLVRD